MTIAPMVELSPTAQDDLAGVYLIGEEDEPKMATCVLRRGEEYHMIWVGGAVDENTEDFSHYLRQFFAHLLYQYRHSHFRRGLVCLTTSDLVKKLAFEMGFQLDTEIYLYRKQGVGIPEDDTMSAAFHPILPVTLRQVQVEELEEIIRLEHQIFLPEMWADRVLLQEMIERGEGSVHVAICMDQWIGYHDSRILENDLGHLVRLGVHPDYQGLGVGTELLRAGLAWFRTRKVEEIILYVEEWNRRARALYTRFGFQFETKEWMLRYEEEVQ